MSSKYKESYHDVCKANEARGKLFLKMVILAASKHKMALETHILKAKETGVTEGEIILAFRLLIPTRCFPNFIETYLVVKGIEKDRQWEMGFR
jgi:alkylhydroperoxidase/carboxymuconolactone decarboxylase family protein YurZ